MLDSAKLSTTTIIEEIENIFTYVLTFDITVIENIIESDFDSPHAIYPATNNNIIEGLFVTHMVHFMANNGDIKGKFGSEIPLQSYTHLATIGKGFGYGVAMQIVAFLSTVCGLIIGLLVHIHNIILKFCEKEKEREEYDNIIKVNEIKGATTPNATNFNCDFGFDREIAGGIEFGTVVPSATSGIFLKFCGKESVEGLKCGALSPAIGTGYDNGLFANNTLSVF